MDVRERPIRLQRGIGALAAQTTGGGILAAGHRVHLLDGAAAGDFAFVRRGGDSQQGARPQR